MKHIYVFGTRGFPNVQGGVEKHCEQLYPELDTNYQVIVFRRNPFIEKGAKREFKGIHFIDLPSTRIKGFEPFFHSLLCTFYCIIKRPNIVHVHNIGPGMFIPLLRLFGLKVVLTYHSANYEHKKWNFFAKKILKLSEKLSVNCASHIIFVNKMQMKLFNARIQKKSTYIPNGVQIKTPSKAINFIQGLGLKPQMYILAVGRITQEKGFDYLIDSYVQSGLTKYKLVLAGGVDHNSSYATKIKKMAKEHQIIMPGYVDGEFLRQLYSHAKLFVLPSYNEGFPLVLLEAMSYHLSILASDITANKLLELPSEDYFKTGDILNLSNKLKQKLTEENSSHHYKIEDFTWKNVSQKVADVYAKI